MNSLIKIFLREFYIGSPFVAIIWLKIVKAIKIDSRRKLTISIRLRASNTELLSLITIE